MTWHFAKAARPGGFGQATPQAELGWKGCAAFARNFLFTCLGFTEAGVKLFPAGPATHFETLDVYDFLVSKMKM